MANEKKLPKQKHKKKEETKKEIKSKDLKNEKLQTDVKDLLDEIDDVLEENASEFVDKYIQRGGE